jgi:histidinol-phosphate aminotransferase
MPRYWSDRLQGLTPYTPGEQPKERNIIKLNTNENPYPPSPKVLEAVRQAAGGELRRYPDPECMQVRQAIARRYGMMPEQVFVGNGSDEVLAFAFQALFPTDRPVIFPDITYSFYPVFAQMFGLHYRTVPVREDFSIPVDEMQGEGGGVIFPNPNAPTGKALTTGEIRRILEQNPDAAVVVDEAYVDFGTQSAVPLIQEYPNLLVVQTLSKSRSLAGLRIGFAMGDTDLIAGIDCVKNAFNSYTVDRLAAAAAVAAMEDETYFQATREKIMQVRAWSLSRLQQLGFSVCGEAANFLFVTHPAVPAACLQQYLREQGILVRHFSQPRIEPYLRITVGTAEEMQALCDALERFLTKSERE